MSDEQDSWLSHPIFGVDLGSVLESVENTASSASQSALNAVGYSSDPDQGGSSQAAPPARSGGPDSDDYKQGYKDGRSGGDPQPAPRSGDALIDYEEGYAKGHYEFSQPPPPPPATDPGNSTSDPPDVDPRPLSADELADAKVIFGDSLEYSEIEVDGGAAATVGGYSRTIGNTVHLVAGLFVRGTAETTTEGKRILVHELTHVWQYQHQGWTYAPEAVWAQAKAAWTGGDAYDWKQLVHTPWEQWNPEAQAEAVEDYNRALHNVNNGRGQKEDYENLALLQQFVEKLLAGPAAGPPPATDPPDPDEQSLPGGAPPPQSSREGDGPSDAGAASSAN